MVAAGLTRSTPRALRLIGALWIVLLAFPAQAQIYKFVDENGVTHYTNRKPLVRGPYKVMNFKCQNCQQKRVDWHRVPLNLRDFSRETASAARRHGVDEALVRAIIHAESWYNRTAVSHAGAQGLMQLMPQTASRYGVKSLFNAAQNIDAGVRHLRFLLEMFENDYALASAAYNAGENAVKRYGGVPPYKETKNYVDRVRILRRRYASAIRNSS